MLINIHVGFAGGCAWGFGFGAVFLGLSGDLGLEFCGVDII